MQHILLVLVAVLAVVVALAGAVMTWWYVVDIWLDTVGDADRSMTFWGLPFLFGGIIFFGAAGALGLIAWRLFRDVAGD